MPYGYAAAALLALAAACDTPSEPALGAAGDARGLMVSATQATPLLFDTVRNLEGAQAPFGPPDETTTKSIGDDTHSLNWWIDGKWINHRLITLVQETGVIDMPVGPDLMVEWAILDDWFPGPGGVNDFIGVLAVDRNNNGMVDYPDEVIGFIGRCSLTYNDTYIVNDGVTGKPRWVHWENHSSDYQEMYHYIYDPATNRLKIFHKRRDGTTVKVYEGPPIKDPAKIPPPDPATTTTTTTTGATNFSSSLGTAEAI